MSQSIPKTCKQWSVVSGQDGFDSLKFTEQPIPELGDNQVLVKLQGASINYRDLMVAQGSYPFGLSPNVVPGSDGAGTVLATGRHATRFQPGDRVITTINPRHLGGAMTLPAAQHGTGATVDGTLRTHGVFDEQGLVAMPEGLTFVEAATLSCAGLTAWNALFGLSGRQVSAGQWVLTQGTGGVSLFAVQLAKAVGARVIATTSSTEKGKILEKLGADHIINYRETPEWGAVAKSLTAGGVGVDLVVEVAGPASIAQSVESLRLDGTLTIVGSVGSGGDTGKALPGLMNCWMSLFTTRGVWVGNRLQLEDLCRAVEANVEKLRPVIDPKVFKLEELREAYEYQAAGKHQGKVGIEIA